MERVDGERRAWQETGDAGVPHNDPNAFVMVFTQFAPALYDFLARLSGRSEAADALLRQAASQAAMSAASAAQWPSERAWLFARAVAVLPTESKASNADPAPFTVADPARLPPSPPDSGLADMARVVWRAISALSVEQHALLHLHVREGMVTGEAASALGITEREAAARLNRVISAVEETSRALFLIRYGRSRDPRLNELLEDRNVTRLTPELRAFLEDYLQTTPSAQAMLGGVPAPLTVYAAFRSLPIPEGLAAEAASGALPWLASGGSLLPAGAPATAAFVPEQDPPGFFAPEASSPGYDPSGATAVNDAYPYGPDGQTFVTPPASPNAYDPYTYGTGGYDPYGYGPGAGYSGMPVGSGPIEGTQTLDIPVRQRVVGDAPPVFVPPRRPEHTIPPIAILGGVGGALVLIIGALVIFLSRGASESSARVTAPVGATTTTTVTATIVVSMVPDALLTSTAIVVNRLLTATASAPTPTAIPTTTSSPQPVRSITDVTTTASPSASPAASLTASPSMPAEPPTPFIVAPRITQAPYETPVARVTSIPTRALATATRPPTVEPTTRPTSAATSAATVVSTTAPRVVTAAAPTAAATTSSVTAPTEAATGTATTAVTANPGVTAVATSAADMMKPSQTTTATAASSGIEASNSSVSIGASASGSVTVTNKAQMTSFTTASNNSHLTVSPASGSIAAGGSANITISVNRAGLDKGTYNGAVSVMTGNGTVTVNVSFTVA